MFETDYDIAAFNMAINNRTFGTSTPDFNTIAGARVETAIYNIVGTYCESVGIVAASVLLATHGITLDRL